MTNSRRTFIKQTSAVLAGATFLPSVSSMAQPVRSQKVGIQLFSLEKEMINDARGTLKSLKDSGYEFIEHSNYANRKFYDFTPKDFQSLVKDSGLALASGHVVLEPRHWIKKTNSFQKVWRQAIDDAAMAGQEFLVTPWLDKRFWTDESGLKEFLQVFNKCGELCRNSGIKFGYHNHDFEFTHHFRQQSLYDIILQETDPYLVTQQLDIGNMQHDKFAVTDLVNSCPGRFGMMHIKNIEHAESRHVMYQTAPLNAGVLDLEKILSVARKTGGTSEFILDQGHAPSTSATNSASVNLRFLKQIMPVID